MDLLYAKAKELCGMVSGEHGIGYVKRPYLDDYLNDGSLEIMKAIKLAIDPKNILNPQKVCE